MKKTIVMVLITLLAFFVSSGTLLAAPVVGIWNADDLGTAALNYNTDPGIFQGVFVVLDPEADGSNVGDTAYSRDNSAGAAQGDYYWAISNMTRDTLNYGPIEDIGDGRGRQYWSSTQSGGTGYLWGDKLWGQETGTIYYGPRQSESSGYNYYTRDSVDSEWLWDYGVGTTYTYGTFTNAPGYASVSTGDAIIYGWTQSPVYGLVMYGTYSNVEITITSTPLPSALWLFGSAVFGLIGIRVKHNNSSWMPT